MKNKIKRIIKLLSIYFFIIIYFGLVCQNQDSAANGNWLSTNQIEVCRNEVCQLETDFANVSPISDVNPGELLRFRWRNANSGDANINNTIINSSNFESQSTIGSGSIDITLTIDGDSSGGSVTRSESISITGGQNIRLRLLDNSYSSSFYLSPDNTFLSPYLGYESWCSDWSQACETDADCSGGTTCTAGYPQYNYSDNGINISDLLSTGLPIGDATYYSDLHLNPPNNQIFTAGLGENTLYFSVIVECADDYTKESNPNFGTVGEPEYICVPVVINNPPDDPTDPSPSDGTITNDNKPTLSARYSDPDTDDTGFTFYRIATSETDCLDDAGTHTQTKKTDETSTNNEITTWTLTTPLADGTYYWCAQNVDEHDATSDWVGMGSFTVDAYHEVTIQGYIEDDQTTPNRIPDANVYACEGTDCTLTIIGITNSDGNIIFESGAIDVYGGTGNTRNCSLKDNSVANDTVFCDKVAHDSLVTIRYKFEATDYITETKGVTENIISVCPRNINMLK